MAALPKNRKKIDSKNANSIQDPQSQEENSTNMGPGLSPKPVEKKLDEAFSIVEKLETEKDQNTHRNNEKSTTSNKKQENKSSKSNPMAQSSITVKEKGIHVSIQVDTPEFLMAPQPLNKDLEDNLLDLDFTIPYPWNNGVVKDLVQNLPKDLSQGLDSLIKLGLKIKNK